MHSYISQGRDAYVLAYIQFAADLMASERLFFCFGYLHQKTSVLNSRWGRAGLSEPLLRSRAARLKTTVAVLADMILLHVVPIDQCVCFAFFETLDLNVAEIKISVSSDSRNQLYRVAVHHWSAQAGCQDGCLVGPQWVVVADLQTSFQIRDLNMSLCRRHAPFLEGALLFFFRGHCSRWSQTPREDFRSGLTNQSWSCCEQEVRPERRAQEGVWLSGGIVKLFSSHCCGKLSKSAWFTLKTERLVPDFTRLRWLQLWTCKWTGCLQTPAVSLPSWWAKCVSD